MLKKKDKLLDILKNQQKYTILPFLVNSDLHNLALTSKKYYITILPYIKVKELDDNSSAESEKTQNIKNHTKRNKRTKEMPICPTKQQTQLQTQVTITKLPLISWFKSKQTCLPQWQRIQQLPYFNIYLQSKLKSKNYIFYSNKSTNQIMYLNRSMIDPNLNFEKGSFNEQLVQDDIYQHMYEESNEVELDMTSRETLLKRQREMLERINKKIEKNIQNQTIFYQKQLQKACNMKKYSIILCFGGSFSISIYDNFKSTTHKSDKKYVCRKKAGQRQLNKDKQSGSSIKSMGSQIRRDQQKKHVINVNQILNEYREQLFKCDQIFLQAPGINRLYIINENQTIAQLQMKLRSVCGTAKKANFTQIQVLNQVINTVHVVKIKEQIK